MRAIRRPNAGPRSDVAEDVETAAHAVGHEDETIRAHEDVIDLDRLLARRRVGNVARDLLRMKRVGSVVDANASVEVRDIHDAIAHVRSGSVLVKVVRPETEPARAVVAGGDRKPRDLTRTPLVGDVDEVHVLTGACAARLDG